MARPARPGRNRTGRSFHQLRRFHPVINSDKVFGHGREVRLIRLEHEMDPIVDNESPRARLALLLQQFSELDDDREAWRVVYPIEEVLLLVTCATIASCDDFEDIVEWGEHHLDFLRQFSDFHHGIPCARWLRDLVNRIDPALFACCFKSWVAALWPGHTLSAYATTASLTLAQLGVPEKPTEITAIPE